jgi:subtilisin family serine protease
VSKGNPKVMRTVVAVAITVIATMLTVYVHAQSVRHGFLAGRILASRNLTLRDPQGHWYLVQGIPINPRPYTDTSVTTAVIDSGVLPDHPQLKGLIADQRDFTGEGPADVIGHGTIVTILTLNAAASLPPEQQANLPSPRIIVAKVAHSDGTIDKNAVIEAIDWVAQRSARVVNLSLQFIEGTDDYSGLCDAIVRNSQVMFVAAAGNEGPDVKVFPAACDAANLIPVAATGSAGDLATYSGQGDVAAPGTAILVPSTLGP